MNNHNPHFNKTLTRFQAEQILQLQSAPQWEALETYLTQLAEQSRTELETSAPDRTLQIQGRCSVLRDIQTTFTQIKNHN
jgi:hypothetical protein